jgi:phage terminase Nu1 subunit (DNA packaging protein)
MNDEVTTADLCRLLGVSRETLSSLAKRGIVVRSGKRGAYALEASVSGYCKHLRDMASARGGEDAIAVRAKLASAQADLAAEKVKVMRAETVPAAEVEALWTSKLHAFRNRILGIPGRVQYLSARQTVVLQQELRAALDELANDKGV